MSTLFILKYITPIYDLFVKAMSTIQNRRSEGHKDETQLKATAQVMFCLWSGGWVVFTKCEFLNIKKLELTSYNLCYVYKQNMTRFLCY